MAGIICSNHGKSAWTPMLVLCLASEPDPWWVATPSGICCSQFHEDFGLQPEMAGFDGTAVRFKALQYSDFDVLFSFRCWNLSRKNGQLRLISNLRPILFCWWQFARYAALVFDISYISCYQSVPINFNPSWAQVAQQNHQSKTV